MTVFSFNCFECSFTCKQEPKFLSHLVDCHNISPVEIQSLYDKHVLKNARPLCSCGCGNELSWSGWKKGYTSLTFGTGFIRGHNARVSTSFTDPKIIEKMKLKRSEGLVSGRNKVWNTGLSKETDERVAKCAENISNSLNKGYENGSIIDWRKKDPEKALQAAAKSSKTKKEQYKNGFKNWNSGLTKETDERVAKAAVAIRENYKENPNASAKRLTHEEILNRLSVAGNLVSLSSLNEYKNKYTKLQFQCRTCNHVFQRSLMYLQGSSSCPSCSPKESKGQLELYEFIKTISQDAILSDRSVINPKELDVWVPSKNFAFEYNGLYWHSEIYKNSNYHFDKTERCEMKGIKYIQLFN
jgi:hypothetical protein